MATGSRAAAPDATGRCDGRRAGPRRSQTGSWDSLLRTADADGRRSASSPQAAMVARLDPPTVRAAGRRTTMPERPWATTRTGPTETRRPRERVLQRYSRLRHAWARL
eukprot:7202617-Prymnesium_polylepis.3